MQIFTRNNKGLTFIELIVAIAILSIITGIAISLFTGNIRRGRRMDAINPLLSISLAEERYRSNNTSYGTLAQVWGGVTASPEGYYTLSISNVSATGYTVTAAANGNQANDAVNGVSCSSMVLQVSNGAVSKTPTACWPT